jgi:hypothetical protein
MCQGIRTEHTLCTKVHYRSKVWGHLEMSLFLKEKHIFCLLNYQKYSVDVNVVNDYCSWKRQICYGIST